MKKTLVVLLALVMVFAFATTAYAADTQYTPYTDIANEDADIQTAIERLSILGALKGYNAEGTIYAPANLITREEFATIGVRIAGMEDQVALYASLASAFKDVEEGRWSEGYINCANANGIMIGRGSGLFDPKANVTMQEVVTVLLRAVGYTDQLPGSWPTDYNKKAVNVGLTEYVDFIGPKYASRGEVASLVNETLDLYCVTYVDNEFAQGLGQTIGFMTNMMINLDVGPYNDLRDYIMSLINYVDEDGFAYRTFKTNDNKQVGSSLLTQTFNAYVLSEIVFYDDDEAYSEAAAWGLVDYDDWELESYFWGWVYDYDEEEYEFYSESMEFATLYGISGGQDVTDLGWQVADLTVSVDDDEIIYANTLSEITRIAELEDDYEDTWIPNSTIIKEEWEDYGEVWFYDWSGKGTKTASNYYAAKDFEDFTGREYHIVVDMDDDEWECYGGESYDLDDDLVYYLMGTGFIAGADLEINDVVYWSSLPGADALGLVFRPAEGTLDDYGNDFIEFDDIDYYDSNSRFSIDKGETIEEYTENTVYNVEFSDTIFMAPAYAFNDFSYFYDNLQMYKYGILDSYIFGKASTKQRLNPYLNYDIVTGMNVLLPGEDELTAITFADSARVYDPDASWDEDDLAEVFPEEGSLVEFVLDNDGECIDWRYCPYHQDADVILGHSWNKISWFDWFDGIVEPELCCVSHADPIPNHGYAVGEWSNKGRLDITLYQGPWTQPVSDVYKFADDAVIFLVDSTGSSSNAYPDAPYVYDFDSARCLTYEDFKALGDFTARDLCIYSRTGTTIDILYVCDFEANDEEVYGFGLYTGKAARSVSLDAYYVVIGSQVVVVDESVFAALEDRTPGLVAYKTSDGEVKRVQDFLLINKNHHAQDITKYYQQGWYDELEYVIGCGDVRDFDDNELRLLDFYDYLLDINLGERTLFSDDFVAGYNYLEEDVIDITTLEDDLLDFTNPHAIVVFPDDDNNDLLYMLLFEDETPPLPS